MKNAKRPNHVAFIPRAVCYTLEERLPQKYNWVSLELRELLWIEGCGLLPSGSLIDLTCLISPRFVCHYLSRYNFLNLSFSAFWFYKFADIMTEPRMLHSSRTSVERCRSRNPQSSASMSSSATIPTQPQKAAKDSHLVTGQSSRSRALTAPIDSMDEGIESPYRITRLYFANHHG